MSEPLDSWNDEPPVADGEQTLEERAMHLRNLAAAGGVTGLLASELLVAMEERHARAERDRLVAEGVEALGEGELDLGSAETRAQLSAVAAEQRQQTSTSYLAAREAEYAKKFGLESAAEMMPNERQAIQEVEAFLGGPEASDLAVVHEYERRQADQAKANDAAWELAHRFADGWALELAEAEEQIAATLARHAVLA